MRDFSEKVLVLSVVKDIPIISIAWSSNLCNFMYSSDIRMAAAAPSDYFFKRYIKIFKNFLNNNKLL